MSPGTGLANHLYHLGDLPNLLAIEEPQARAVYHSQCPFTKADPGFQVSPGLFFLPHEFLPY
jgi:hypothetical protein